MLVAALRNNLSAGILTASRLPLLTRSIAVSLPPRLESILPVAHCCDTNTFPAELPSWLIGTLLFDSIDLFLLRCLPPWSTSSSPSLPTRSRRLLIRERPLSSSYFTSIQTKISLSPSQRLPPMTLFPPTSVNRLFQFYARSLLRHGPRTSMNSKGRS